MFRVFGCRVSAGAVGSALLLAIPSALAQPHPDPNSDSTYQQLRSISLGGEATAVSNLALHRDAGTLVLHSGTVCFVAPVAGRVTGAVFVGDGNFGLDPPTESERKTLRLLTKGDEFRESFSRLVLRFTDSTYDEIKKAGSSAIAGGCDAGPLKDSQNVMRHKLNRNLEVRLLQDILSPEPGRFFLAFVHGKRYSDKELFSVDPRRTPDEVELSTYDENKLGTWAAFPLSGNDASNRQPRGRVIRIEHQQLDTTLEKSGGLRGRASTTFISRVSGLRVVPFDLFPSLRVDDVTAGDGQPLFFVQEGKNDDPDFAVILPKPLAVGDRYTITTSYGGKEAVMNQGGGNYFPVARDNWYPNTAFGQYQTYDMTFRIPKGMKMAATGVLVSENNEGSENVTVWKSEAPQTVAGFSFGKFKKEEAKLDKPPYLVQSYANEESPDWVQSLARAASGDSAPGTLPRGLALGTLSTTGLNKKALAETEVALEVYTDYFGPSSFRHLQVTQQTACNFGQSWPELVWIPICYYFDTTVRHQLGMDWGDRGYWRVVTPHEVAHQWWGHTIGFDSYRDQWMSEGFADMSAALYLSATEKNLQKTLSFWKDERELLLERNAQGFRAIDAGPVTMGYRMSNSRTGFDVTRRLIYPKGAYILHMIRMMMWDRRNGDRDFKEMMQDFVKTYSGKAASTEDFKAIVEKHMNADMKAMGDSKMDWFFGEYVYGTQLPSYSFDSSFETSPEGDVVLKFTLSQANVDDRFRMLVPIYLEMADGRTVMLGHVRISGSSTAEQKVPLRGLKEKPRKAIINYMDDVLAAN